MNGKNNGVDLRNIEVGDWNGKCTGGWRSKREVSVWHCQRMDSALEL